MYAETLCEEVVVSQGPGNHRNNRDDVVAFAECVVAMRTEDYCARHVE